MNEYQILLKRFRAEAEMCRREAQTQITRAEIYEACAYRLEASIESRRQEKEKEAENAK